MKRSLRARIAGRARCFPNAWKTGSLRVGALKFNGTEFTSMAVLRCAQERRIEWHYIAR
jgi:hypothetical protein